ncbi:hypothetical protein F511_38433 [Dorcoceras hygrometricum]|uniref:Uncharacterized protein n=1 Tax=Dorcoceras hygrometricum TaxID=472368 RepID=A0A2Z7C2Z8_9LAMI|nr:hypothetical protein F511_38433 [Dorcoceras hygrometricum]
MLMSWLLNSASSISNADVMVAEFCFFNHSATFNSSFAYTISTGCTTSGFVKSESTVQGKHRGIQMLAGNTTREVESDTIAEQELKTVKRDFGGLNEGIWPKNSLGHQKKFDELCSLDRSGGSSTEDAISCCKKSSVANNQLKTKHSAVGSSVVMRRRQQLMIRCRRRTIQTMATVIQMQATVIQMQATVIQMQAIVIQMQATVIQMQATAIQIQATVIQPQATEFPPLKILTARTVGRYISINDKISVEDLEDVRDVSRVKKTPIKRAVSKKRPATAAAELVVRKKRTLKGKEAPSNENLELVSVAQEAVPLQVIKPITAAPPKPKRKAPKRKLILPAGSADEIAEEETDVEKQREEPTADVVVNEPAVATFVEKDKETSGDDVDSMLE